MFYIIYCSIHCVFIKNSKTSKNVKHQKKLFPCQRYWIRRFLDMNVLLSQICNMWSLTVCNNLETVTKLAFALRSIFLK